MTKAQQNLLEALYNQSGVRGWNTEFTSKRKSVFYDIYIQCANKQNGWITCTAVPDVDTRVYTWTRKGYALAESLFAGQ